MTDINISVPDAIDTAAGHLKKSAKRYCKKMNDFHGYSLYTADLAFPDVKLSFGIGSFGVPILLLSFLPLVLPAFLWLMPYTAIEASFFPVMIFGLQVSYLPVQIAGFVLHVAVLIAGGIISRKNIRKHYGALRGSNMFSFILQDLTLRLVCIPAGIAFKFWLIWFFLFRQ